MAGKIGVFQNYFCFEVSDGVFYQYEGFLVRNEPSALPGSVWVETSTDEFRYVDEYRNIRRIPGDYIKNTSGLGGSSWVEGNFWEWLDTQQDKRQGKISISHGDAAHADATTGGYTDHSDSPYYNSNYSDTSAHSDSHTDYTSHDNVGHGDYSDQHSDSHVDHSDSPYHGNQHYDYGWHSDTAHSDGGPGTYYNQHSDTGGGYTDHSNISHGDHSNSSSGTHQNSSHSDFPYTDYPRQITFSGGHGDSPYSDTHSDHSDHSDVPHSNHSNMYSDYVAS